MMHLKLNFVQDRNEAGCLIYRLEPSLDAFTQYEGKGSKEVGPTRHAIRALVSREMENARMKLKNNGVGGDEFLGGNTAGKAMAAYRKKDGNGNSIKPVGMNGAGDGKAKVDFFGRPIVEKKPEKKRREEGDDENPFADERDDLLDCQEEERVQKKVKIFYRHHEGSSNAVRRPVKLNSLL